MFQCKRCYTFIYLFIVGLLNTFTSRFHKGFSVKKNHLGWRNTEGTLFLPRGYSGFWILGGETFLKIWPGPRPCTILFQMVAIFTHGGNNPALLRDATVFASDASFPVLLDCEWDLNRAKLLGWVCGFAASPFNRLYLSFHQWFLLCNSEPVSTTHRLSSLSQILLLVWDHTWSFIMLWICLCSSFRGSRPKLDSHSFQDLFMPSILGFSNFL